MVLAVAKCIVGKARYFGLLRGILYLRIVFDEVVLVRHHDHLACTAQSTTTRPAGGRSHVEVCSAQRRNPILPIVYLIHDQGRLVRVARLIEAVATSEWTHGHDISVNLIVDHVCFGFVVGDCAQREGA